MATVIDELVVALKLDPKQFDQGNKDAVRKLQVFEREHERHSKNVARNTENVTQAYQQLQGRLLSIASLFMGGMGAAAFSEQIIRLTAQTGYLAASLGMATDEIAKWQAVGAQKGVAPGEMAASIKSVRDAASDLAAGRQNEVQKFAYMTHNNPGPAVNFTKDTDPTEFMVDVSRWLEYHKKQGPQAYATANRQVSSMLGFGQGTMNVLDMGPDELRKRLKEAKKYAPSEDDVKKFQQLQEAFSRAETAVEALWRSLVALGSTGIVKFFDDAAFIITEFRDKGFVAGLRAYNQVASDSVAQSYGGAVDTVKGWGRSAYNWGRRKLGLSTDEPGDKPATFNERWSGEASAAPSDVLEKARQVALSGGPAAVERFMASQGYPKNGAWCGEFAAATVKAAGGTPPKNPQIASNWRNYGKEVDDPRPGDIAVRRGAPTGSTGSHVTIVEELNGNRFIGLGGNQRAGMRSNFSKSSYQYFRGEEKPKEPSLKSRWNDRIGTLGGAAAATRADESIIRNNSRSTETHVGEIKVHLPPGSDGRAIGRSVSEELRGREPAHEGQD